MNKFYAIHIQDDYNTSLEGAAAADFGSPRKRDALKLAAREHKIFPGSEIVISVWVNGEFQHQWIQYPENDKKRCISRYTGLYNRRKDALEDAARTGKKAVRVEGGYMLVDYAWTIQK